MLSFMDPASKVNRLKGSPEDSVKAGLVRESEPLLRVIAGLREAENSPCQTTRGLNPVLRANQ